jgi:hypothetical protein
MTRFSMGLATQHQERAASVNQQLHELTLVNCTQQKRHPGEQDRGMRWSRSNGESQRNKQERAIGTMTFISTSTTWLVFAQLPPVELQNLTERTGQD